MNENQTSTSQDTELQFLESHLSRTLRRVPPPNGLVERLRGRVQMPTRSEIRLRFYHLNPDENSSVRIFNCLGEEVYSSSALNGDLVVEISSWSAGMYLLQLNSKDASISRKLFVTGNK